MEGNLQQRTMLQSNNVSYGGCDLQEQMRIHHHQLYGSLQRQGSSTMVPTVQENFPLNVTLSDYNKPKSASEDDEPSFAEEPVDAGSGPRKGKNTSSSSSPWQRVKWTDSMVRLLITAVSYISEESAAENGAIGRRKHMNLQKKGKWKSVSKVLADRGFFVSPQQCEDKFNDLNKRYKRLNEILGRGTSCEVVENPSLLDVMDHVSEKAKEEVRKILSSKHLHYEEMCSYHNGNRLHLPADPELQHALHIALGGNDHEETDTKRHSQEDNDNEADQEAEFDDHYGEHDENSSKRARFCQEFSFKNAFSRSLDCNKNGDAEAEETNSMTKNQCSSHKRLQLEEQKLHIEMQLLELEKERFKWQKFCRKKDMELEISKMELERMKLENERMAMELRRKEMGLENI